MTFQTPLKWPDGWERHQGWRSGASHFKSTLDRTKSRLYRELELIGAESCAISSNLPLNMKGEPRGDVARRTISDPGVAVYFLRDGRQLVMARDKYDNVADNLHSLTLALEGLRQMERHGGGALLERAFEGFVALPDQAHWRAALGFGAGTHVTLEDAEAAYKRGAKLCHADTGGGHEQMVKLNAAIAQARAELRG